MKNNLLKTNLVLIISLILIVTNVSSINVETQEDENSEIYDLLIITPNEWINDITKLKNHKEKNNLKTKIVTLSEIYDVMYWEGRDDAEKIKYYIKNAYDNWNIKYVFLIGGIKNQISSEEIWWMPVRYIHLVDRWGGMKSYSEEKYLSDLYFADLYYPNGSFSSWDTNNNGIFGEWKENESSIDQMDLVPEVSIGRLPCRNKIELQIMIQKIISYENNKNIDSWFKNMVVVSGDTYTDNDYFDGEVETQWALDMMPGFNHIKLWTSLETFTGPMDVIKTVNKGCGFLYFAGHSAPTLWGNHPPYNEDVLVKGLNMFTVMLLFNMKKLPVCIIGGCHTSLFNVSYGHTTWLGGRLKTYECLSWKMTRKIGGGSIATIGNTGLGYGEDDKLNPENGGGSGHLNKFFFKSYGIDNKLNLGDCWSNAIETYLDSYPINWEANSYDDTTIDAKTVTQWILFGDPSLKIGGYN